MHDGLCDHFTMAGIMQVMTGKQGKIMRQSHPTDKAYPPSANLCHALGPKSVL